MQTTKEAVDLLQKLGMYDDIERALARKHIRAGRGKMRGRKYKRAKSILVIVSDRKSVEKAFRNLGGVDIANPANLSVEVLAPGGDPGRLVLISEKALKEIGEWQL